MSGEPSVTESLRPTIEIFNPLRYDGIQVVLSLSLLLCVCVMLSFFHLFFSRVCFSGLMLSFVCVWV